MEDDRDNRPADDDDRDLEGLDDETIDEVRWFLKGTLERMGFEAKLDLRRDGPEALLEISGADEGQVIGKKGMTLDALQVLCNRVARKFSHSDRGFVVLDAGGYRARREKNLTDHAIKLGEQVVRDRRAVTMEPMTPRDRRVVHMALARFAGVRTQSEGEGSDRRLRIIPVAKRDAARIDPRTRDTREVRDPRDTPKEE
jgi:spoIIIJ-associated protein